MSKGEMPVTFALAGPPATGAMCVVYLYLFNLHLAPIRVVEVASFVGRGCCPWTG